MVYHQDRLFLVNENLGDLLLTQDFKTYVFEQSFRLHFCRKADPQSKGKVENVVKFVKNNFQGVSCLEFAENLLNVEIKYRNHKDQGRKIKTARLPGTHDLPGYDCSLAKGMPSARLEQLIELTWLDQNFNLIIMGPNGIGKSFLAAGLCHQSIEGGYRTYFRPMEQLMSMLKTKEQSRSAMVDYKRLLKAHLIVIDYIMLITMARNEANSFFHFVNALHEKVAFGITTNKSSKEWVRDNW